MYHVGLHMIVGGLPFLVMAALFMVLARVNKAELNNREKLPEIEYHLAELVERMEKREGGE